MTSAENPALLDKTGHISCIKHAFFIPQRHTYFVTSVEAKFMKLILSNALKLPADSLFLQLFNHCVLYTAGCSPNCAQNRHPGFDIISVYCSFLMQCEQTVSTYLCWNPLIETKGKLVLKLVLCKFFLKACSILYKWKRRNVCYTETCPIRNSLQLTFIYTCLPFMWISVCLVFERERPTAIERRGV